MTDQIAHQIDNGQWMLPLLPSTLPVRPHEGWRGRMALKWLGVGQTVDRPYHVMGWLAHYDVDISDDESMHAAIRSQIGKRWTGFENASLVTKVLLLRASLFALHKDRERYERLAHDIARSPAVRDDAILLRGFVEEHSGDAAVMAWIASVGKLHAFERTLVLGATDRARMKSGVMGPSALEGWIAFHDRVTWAALTYLGRKYFVAEPAVVHFHYHVERKLGTALREHQVTEAAMAIRAAHASAIPSGGKPDGSVETNTTH